MGPEADTEERLVLATRIIPTLLCRGAALYKGERFNSWRQVGHALQATKIHQARGVDELILLDIGATPEGRGPNFAMVEQLAECCFMPLTVGGGVRSVEDVRGLLNAGADKVAICTAVATDLLAECAGIFGRQALVASIDVKDGCAWTRCGTYKLRGDTVGDINPVVWTAICENEGAGEILLTSIDRDGTLQGYDLDLIREVSQAVSIPVIASGGCGTYEHMYEAIQAGASAVAAGAMFLFTDQTPKGAAQYLAQRGIETRL